MTTGDVAARPRLLAANPRLSRWLHIEPDGTVLLRMGKVELGQGILTALAQIAADELDVNLDAIRVVAANTVDGPDLGGTSGSMSVADAGAALRVVCASVRALSVAEGVALADLDLDRDVLDDAPVKAAGDLRVVGTSVPRLDLPALVAGRPRFIHDLSRPGQLVGRVCRPPSPAATLAELDPDPLRSLPGVVSVVRDGSFLGVVAESTTAADRAVERLRALARWREEATLPDEHDLGAHLRAGPVEISIVDIAETDGAPRGQWRRATFGRPFLAHASVAPSCGVAQWDGPALRVWSHSQNIHALRRAIAAALGIDADRVAVWHVEGAGCYGHNGADDAAFDAVLLARSVPGRPVQVTWSRHDELAWAPFGSAMVADVAAATDADGAVVDWTFDVFSQGHIGRPGATGQHGAAGGAGRHGNAGGAGLLAAAHRAGAPALAPPVDPAGNDGGSSRNSVPIYAFARRRIRAHVAQRAALRSSSLRSLGAHLNVFAIESFMDELALAHGRDPLEYRLAHLEDPRARHVLLTATDLAGWDGRAREDGVGHGIGLARYKGYGAICAVVAEVEAVREIRVRRLAVAVDVGRIVNPDGVVNQIEGGAVQATSWTLKERVRFDRRHVTSGDWQAYPILRFSEVPAVDVRLVSRADEPSVGAGEAAQGPTAAAIGNAVADALGVRVRELPITAERVVSVLDERAGYET